jgi:hypothetical protein
MLAAAATSVEVLISVSVVLRSSLKLGNLPQQEEEWRLPVEFWRANLIIRRS